MACRDYLRAKLNKEYQIIALKKNKSKNRINETLQCNGFDVNFECSDKIQRSVVTSVRSANTEGQYDTKTVTIA